MSTDIRDMTDTVEEVAFGAAETAAEIASNPIGAVRRQVKGLERKGTPAARKATATILHRRRQDGSPPSATSGIAATTCTTMPRVACTRCHIPAVSTK